MLDGTPPTQLDVGRMSDIVIDEDVYAGASPEDVAEATAEAEQIQQALLEGEGEIELDATAAGGAGGAGGGHPIVEFDETGNEVNPEAGAETEGLGFGFPDGFEGDAEDSIPILIEDTEAMEVDEDGLAGANADAARPGEETGTGLATDTGNLADNFSFGDGQGTPVILSVNGQTAQDGIITVNGDGYTIAVSYTHLRAHET